MFEGVDYMGNPSRPAPLAIGATLIIGSQLFYGQRWWPFYGAFGGHLWPLGGWLAPHIIHVEPYNRIYPRFPQSRCAPLASITTNVVLNFLQSRQ